MPCRERQTIQVRNWGAGDGSGWNVASGDSHRRLFRLTFDEKVRMVLQKLGHVRRGGAKKSDAHSIPALRFSRPGHFILVVNKGTENKGDVAVNKFLSGNAYVVSRSFKNRRQIAGMDAW